MPKITAVVDVLLAVIMMMLLLSVRLSQEGIDVAAAGASKPRPRFSVEAADIVLEYSADRKITVNKREISRSELGSVLADIYRARSDRTMWLLGAGTVRYGEIVDLIDAAKAAGVERVGVITPEMRKR